ncbi:MAG: FxsA family protein [Betaproteobacteria bacterium]
MAFPVMDLLLTARFARVSGVPLWMWLTGSAIAGLCVLTNERAQFRMRTLAAFRGDQSLMRGLLDSGRRVLAGLLLLAPGLLSDVIGVVLLLLPINQRGRFGPEPVAAGRTPYRRERRTLDADYRRID